MTENERSQRTRGGDCIDKQTEHPITVLQGPASRGGLLSICQHPQYRYLGDPRWHDAKDGLPLGSIFDYRCADKRSD
jgi:hypothetical protein